MAVTTVIAIYFIIWWVVLFAVLPWGVRSQEESGAVAPGTDPGAPVTHRIWSKLMWTTIVASAVFALLVAIYRFNLIPFDLLLNIAGPRH